MCFGNHRHSLLQYQLPKQSSKIFTWLSRFSLCQDDDQSLFLNHGILKKNSYMKGLKKKLNGKKEKDSPGKNEEKIV